MCGEHGWCFIDNRWYAGSSPHVRGAQERPQSASGPCRIIPACAGSTGVGIMTWLQWQDHPRMCGEHLSGPSGHSLHLGSSPHVRGALSHGLLLKLVSRIIPACAGSTYKTILRGSVARDHPRMCGEHRPYSAHCSRVQGSSPHVRGAQLGIRAASKSLGIIPACAGSTCCCCPC